MARITGRRCAYTILVGKQNGTRPTGRTRHRLEDNLKMYAEEIRWGGINYPFISQRVGETGRFL